MSAINLSLFASVIRASPNRCLFFSSMIHSILGYKYQALWYCIYFPFCRSPLTFFFFSNTLNLKNLSLSLTSMYLIFVKVTQEDDPDDMVMVKNETYGIQASSQHQVEDTSATTHNEYENVIKNDVYDTVM